MKKRILITYATYGSGHKTVAKYIYDYLVTNFNNKYEIKMIDLMDYENIIGLISKKKFEKVFKYKIESFFFSIAYELFDTKATTLPYKAVTKALFKNKTLQEDIVNFNPDVLISTHFFGNIILGMFNRRGLTNTKIMSIITDYKSHMMWIKDEKSINAFIVSNDIVKKDLIEKGINKKKIYSYGIPISENFNTLTSKESIRKKYKIAENNNLTFLFFAGGSIGSSYSYHYFKKLLEEELNINIIYVCGKNTKLKAKAEELVENNDYQNVTILGFSNEVNNLLNISDFVITKPGGLSITESLEMKKPMILIPGNGGNEIYNAKFVCHNGYGLNCKTAHKLVKVVKKINKKEFTYQSLIKNIQKYGNNKSLEKISKLLNKII